MDTRRGIPYLHSPTYYSPYMLELRSWWSSILHRHVRIQRSWDDRKIVTSPLMLTLNSTRLASISSLLGYVRKLLWPKSATATSIWSRQFQFDHGNFNLTTAIQFDHGNFNFTFTTAIFGNLGTICNSADCVARQLEPWNLGQRRKRIIDSRGVSKTQTSDPKNSDPLGVSKTQTLRKLGNSNPKITQI